MCKQLPEERIHFFYKLLYYVERTNDFRYLKDYRNLPPHIKTKLTLNKTKSIDKKKDLPPNTIIFKEYTNPQKHVKSQSATILFRLRNSFAHCLIAYNETQDEYRFEDRYRDSTTMVGRVNRELLEKFITYIIQEHKKELRKKNQKK